MASIVTYEKLFSESRNNVVELITANVSDPISSSGQYRKWIYSRVPDIKSEDFKGYPFIVVQNSNVIPDGDNQSGDGKHRVVYFDIIVEIYTSDRGYGSKDGLGSSQIDSISDELISVFLNKTHRETLINNRMSMSKPTTDEVEVIPLKNELIYTRTINLSFGNRMVVSA